MTTIVQRATAGAAAGLAATGIMTVAMAGAKKAGVLGEMPPRKLTRRLLAPLAPFLLNDDTLDLATTAAHLGFGAAMGSIFAAPRRTSPSAVGGAVFGLGVWTATYAGIIPKLGLMRTPGNDRLGRPTSMIVAHLVYGASLGALYRRWLRRRPVELTSDAK